jgi:hypothetical protein
MFTESFPEKQKAPVEEKSKTELRREAGTINANKQNGKKTGMDKVRLVMVNLNMARDSMAAVRENRLREASGTRDSRVCIDKVDTGRIMAASGCRDKVAWKEEASSTGNMARQVIAKTEMTGAVMNHLKDLEEDAPVSSVIGKAKEEKAIRSVNTKAAHIPGLAKEDGASRINMASAIPEKEDRIIADHNLEKADGENATSMVKDLMEEPEQELMAEERTMKATMAAEVLADNMPVKIMAMNRNARVMEVTEAWVTLTNVAAARDSENTAAEAVEKMSVKEAVIGMSALAHVQVADMEEKNTASPGAAEEILNIAPTAGAVPLHPTGNGTGIVMKKISEILQGAIAEERNNTVS